MEHIGAFIFIGMLVFCFAFSIIENLKSKRELKENISGLKVGQVYSFDVIPYYKQEKIHLRIFKIHKEYIEVYWIEDDKKTEISIEYFFNCGFTLEDS